MKGEQRVVLDANGIASKDAFKKGELMSNYVDDCLDGKAKPKDIDRYVSAWHRSDTTQKVTEFLGLTFEEYGKWLMNEDSIVEIIEARRQQAAKK